MHGIRESTREGRGICVADGGFDASADIADGLGVGQVHIDEDRCARVDADGQGAQFTTDGRTTQVPHEGRIGQDRVEIPVALNAGGERTDGPLCTERDREIQFGPELGLQTVPGAGVAVAAEEAFDGRGADAGSPEVVNPGDVSVQHPSDLGDHLVDDLGLGEASLCIRTDADLAGGDRLGFQYGLEHLGER